MTEFKLIQEDAPRAQGSLFDRFEGIGDGRAEGELLQRVTAAVGLATVDDLLAWQDGDEKQGACITCGRPRQILAGLHRIYCDRCGTHTVCRVQDIARGDTPGPVKGMRAGDYLYNHDKERG